MQTTVINNDRYEGGFAAAPRFAAYYFFAC